MTIGHMRLVGLVALAATAPLLSQCAQNPSVGVKPVTSQFEAQENINPVDLIKQAGATPQAGAKKGELDIDGFWYASGTFPASSPENASVGAFTQILIRVFPNRSSLEKAMKKNQDAITTDSNTVLLGQSGRFYAVVTGVMNANGEGVTFDVPLEEVSNRLKATLVP